MDDRREGSRGEDARDPEEIFAEFIARPEAGESSDFEALVAAHPAHEAELRELYRDWSEMRDELMDALRAEGISSIFHRTPARSLDEAERLLLEVREGATIGQYRLVEWLGGGGMGQVWRAVQLPLNREVALKLMRPDKASERYVRFFQREARAGARLNHPGIVTVHEAGKIQGVPYIAQELVQNGSTLRHFIEQARDAPELPSDYYRRLAALFQELTSALQASHDRGVIHRDLKPENILITPDDHPKLSDFGLARIVDEQSISLPGDLDGSLPYMSPEQVSGEHREIDARTDVFSLGVVLYEVLTFRRPFTGDSNPQLMKSILSEDPRDPCTVRRKVPRDLAVLCLRSLEKRKADRFQSVAELGEELQRYLAGEPIQSRPSGPVRKIRKWTRRHATATAVVGLSLASLTIISAFAVKSCSDARERQLAAIEKHETRAILAISQGDLQGARDEIESVFELDPKNIRGHLILALGASTYSQTQEAAQEIQAAIEKGFSTDPSSVRTPTENYGYGLYLMTLPGAPRHREAAQYFEQAIAGDSSLSGAYIPLYQVRRAVGDNAGAIRALEAYQKTIPSGQNFYHVVEALLCEIKGDPEGACAVLDELYERLQGEADAGQEKVKELRLHRLLGRNHLRLEHLDLAERYLDKAIEEFPNDGASMVDLALIHYERALHDDSADGSLKSLRPAEEFLQQGLEAAPHLLHARVFSAALALKRIEWTIKAGQSPATEDWEAAAERIETFRSLRSTDRRIDQLDSELRYLEGLQALSLGDWKGERSAYSESLELNPGNLRARVRRAQVFAERLDDDHSALADLQKALQTWERDDSGSRRGEPWQTPRWNRKWFHAIHVWTFGAAARIGDVELAQESLSAMQAELASNSEFLPEELLNFAEYLATSPTAELVDCVLALEILEENGLRDAFRDDPATRRAVIEIVERIDEACE